MANARLQAYCEKMRGQTVAVIGIGISNRPVIRFLCDMGCIVTARDQKTEEQLGDICAALREMGVRLILGDAYLENITEAYIFKAPGLRYDKKQLMAAVQNGSILTSEMEVFLKLCPCPVFAVTGSDGKTTTTTLSYEMLQEAARLDDSERRVFVGGNIGAPLLPQIAEIRPTDFAVVELSSFQLHQMTVSPPYSAITNLSPNHLNWHTDMDEYVDAKCNIFRHQQPNHRLVLNYDNTFTRSLGATAPSEVTYFSRTQSISPDTRCLCTVTIENEMITVTKNEKKHAVLSIADIRLPGKHNIENYMTAIALTWGFVPFEAIRKVARTFNGVKHRCELVAEKNGVKYYNSSIDSSPTRTIAALESFASPVILMMGGYDKHIPFAPLGAPVSHHAKTVILTGATAKKIKDALLSSPDFVSRNIPIYEESGLTDAIDRAASIAVAGDIVLLSPACASFDAFENFEQRGDTFREYVRKL